MHGLTTKPRNISRDRALVDNPALISRLHDALVELRAADERSEDHALVAVAGCVRTLEEWEEKMTA